MLDIRVGLPNWNAQICLHLTSFFSEDFANIHSSQKKYLFFEVSVGKTIRNLNYRTVSSHNQFKMNKGK